MRHQHHHRADSIELNESLMYLQVSQREIKRYSLKNKKVGKGGFMPEPIVFCTNQMERN
jgi:hypothetical protein